ncbi:uncharacterized protein LOC131873913 [Cryptomeria japonica]|uniref:uncharacterized protein LOC131873913 n=1 Tax=Cryptomeria japonica TaxID=3369 RepID=UPI0027DA6D39|nr:uncharacterized protein LOC131873913 [Cryptomeria japonica]
MDITGKVDDLIDVSAEDDSLLTSPATNYNENFEFSQSPATSVRPPVLSDSPKSKKECGESKEQLVTSKDVVNCEVDKQNIMTNPAIEGGYPPLCEEDLQPKRKKRAAQLNLRKSLAWDQAFFTSEGVLNPVELSLLNKTFSKSNETLLSSIEEEDSVRSSMDSNSTLSGDILALETLEENLFTESHTSNAALLGTVPAQSKLHSLPNTRILATQQKDIATNVPKSPERKSSHGVQDS